MKVRKFVSQVCVFLFLGHIYILFCFFMRHIMANKDGQDFRPTPEQRAEQVLYELEGFIRDHRRETLKGLSLNKWKAQAKEEVARSFARYDNEKRKNISTSLRVSVLMAAGVVTAGFWGIVLKIHDRYDSASAVFLGLAGIVLLYGLAEMLVRTIAKKKVAVSRVERFSRVRSLDQDIKRLEQKMENRKKSITKDLQKFGDTF
jgi:hypothetical protein